MNPKILLVYYSHTGRTAEIARLISHTIGCDEEQLIPDSPITHNIYELRRRILSRGIKTPSKIKPMTHDITQYGAVILGMPVWENNIPAPMRSFLTATDWRGIKIHPFFSTGGIYVSAYYKLCSICKGAAVADPLYLVYDLNGRFLRMRE